MAKRIEGITIEIDGSTTKLNDALKDTTKVISSTNSEIKALNQALKLDPTNTELLTQKQEVLKNNIAATKEKLDTLREAQRQMGDYNSLTDEQKENYRALSIEIAKSESALKNMNTELKNTNKIDLSKAKETLKKVGDVAVDVVKKVSQVTAGIAGALAGVVAAGVKSYAKLEKAQKGSERLFGNSFDIVKENASQAYKTMGLSASEYYDQVNTYAVGLKNALGGDTKKAAELSDSILKAQADIVAATGVSQESVQSAMSAVMRGNYMMLDNLRLGIKGSKEGMEEVIDKVNKWRKAQGINTKLQMGNYADMEQALIDYTKMVNIAGTAEDQMSKTLSGSLTQTKAALDNFINGSGGATELIDTLTNSITLIATAFRNLAPHIIEGLGQVLENVFPTIVDIIWEMAPMLFDTMSKLIKSLFEYINKNKNDIKQSVTMLIKNFAAFLVENLPTIIELGLVLVTTLATGIADSLPELIPSVVDCILKIVEVIIDNLDMIITAAIDIILALAGGLIQALPSLIEKVPILIEKLVNELTKPEMIAKLVSASLTLIIGLGIGIVKAIPELVKMIPKVVTSIKNTLITNISSINWKQLGTDILNGIASGLTKFGSTIKNAAKKIYSEIKNKIVDFFKIGSPSKVMRDEVGQWITRGIGVGIEKGIPQTIRDVNAAMTSLNNGIQSSLNPVINPTANSNPLIIQIENFNNTRNQDVQALAEELEFYRKNSSLARGGN